MRFPYPYLPAEIINVDALLTEWGRWCVYRRPRGPEIPQCGSLEGQYRSPQVWEGAEPDDEEPDWRIGERIEAIVTKFDKRGHKCLKVWYVERPWIKRMSAALYPDDETWAWRRAHVGSAERFWQLLDEARTEVERQWK